MKPEKTITELITFLEELAGQECYCKEDEIEKCHSCEAACILNSIMYVLKQLDDDLFANKMKKK